MRAIEQKEGGGQGNKEAEEVIEVEVNQILGFLPGSQRYVMVSTSDYVHLGVWDIATRKTVRLLKVGQYTIRA